MLASSKITGAFLATFLIGATVGALVQWDYTDTQASDFMKHTSDADAFAARINQRYVTEYQLTPDEIARITPLTREMTQDVFTIRHRFGVDVLSTMDDYHGKIAEQLTPAHRDVYTKANDARKKRLTALLLPDATNAAPTH